MSPRPVRTNRTGSPYRSPTPNRTENDPFAMSPETKRQRRLQENRLKNHKNAVERAKRYATKFKNFINNNVNHALVNSNNVKNIKNPVYLLSDAMLNKNGKVRHVYAKEYLNKTFKNKTVFRSPMTGLPTHPDLIRNYNKNAQNLNLATFQKERKFLTKVFGKKEYEAIRLQHMLGQIKPYHFNFLIYLQKYYPNYIVFVKEFDRGTQPKHIYELSATDIKKISTLNVLLLSLKDAPLLLAPVRAALSVIAEHNYTLGRQSQNYLLGILEKEALKPFRSFLLNALGI